MRPRAWSAVILTAGAALAAAPAAGAESRDLWVAAVPFTWNMVPNGRDAISGRDVPPSESVRPAVVYRRYTRRWRRPLPNVPGKGGNDDLIPGPLIRAKVGDRLRVHFLNRDPDQPHSMHFHGVRYRPGSDGAYLPGFSGPGADVQPGRSHTYRLRAARDSVGVWPYHDHSSSMASSLEAGLYGMLSIRGRREPLPDREFVVVFAPMGGLQTIDGRAFVGNTPVFRARRGDLVQWDVMALGSEHHTFHVHGHRWRTAEGVPEDTRTVGPAESFRVRWRERDAGTWLYHCHVEEHMAMGMIGTYQVRR